MARGYGSIGRKGYNRHAPSGRKSPMSSNATGKKGLRAKKTRKAQLGTVMVWK